MSSTSSRILAVLTLVSVATGTVPAVASRHHAAHAVHRTPVKKKGRRDEAAHAPAAPRGATNVPAAGLKVYCQRNSPLLVRKMTQGAGTTVTVICR